MHDSLSSISSVGIQTIEPLEKLEDEEGISLNSVEPTATFRAEDFLKFVKSKKPVIGARLEYASSITLDGDMLKIEFLTASKIHSEHLSHREALETLRILAKDFFKKGLQVKVGIAPSPEETIKANSQAIDQSKRKKDAILEEPGVQEAVSIFDGILEIRFKEEE